MGGLSRAGTSQGQEWLSPSSGIPMVRDGGVARETVAWGQTVSVIMIVFLYTHGQEKHQGT